MCTSPILIRNKKFRSISINIPTSFVKVPCGTCDECLRKRAKDLFVRARFEAESTFLNGGCGFMCCLTYDDQTMPYLYHLGRRYMVFNKQDVVDFIKRLRTNLDRFYKKHYGTDAPNFKYLITSEFGSDPTRTHRPHYHLIILFERIVSLFTFKKMFYRSLFDMRTGKRKFGFIYQCDVLDMKRGGIRYSSKYILKDVSYEHQSDIINDYIKFYEHYVNVQFDINENPKSQDDFFRNKCIRSTKDYKKAVRDNVLPYRHMRQFYMCSNDFGLSAISSRYGESLFTLGMLNIDMLPYSIPKQVIQRLERVEGSAKRDSLAKSVFMAQMQRIVDDSLSKSFINEKESFEILDFCRLYIQPRFGSLYFISPSGFDYFQRISAIAENVDLSDIINEDSVFYVDNAFFDMRNKVLALINLSDCHENLVFRANLAKARNIRDKENYDKKKRNNPSNY